jgi:hypothetical protein
VRLSLALSSVAVVLVSIALVARESRARALVSITTPSS